MKYSSNDCRSIVYLFGLIMNLLFAVNGLSEPFQGMSKKDIERIFDALQDLKKEISTINSKVDSEFNAVNLEVHFVSCFRSSLKP